MKKSIYSLSACALLLSAGMAFGQAAEIPEMADEPQPKPAKAAAAREPSAARLKQRDEALALRDEIDKSADPAVKKLMPKLRNADPGVREATAAEIAKLGAKAVPTMVMMLKAGDLFPSGGVNDRAQEQVALKVLEKLDPQVKKDVAIPALIAQMHESKSADITWSNSLEALGRMGPDAIPAMIAELDRGVGLADIAGKIGEAARPASGRIIEQMSKAGYMERWIAAQALSTARPDLQHTDAILKLLKEDEYGMAQDVAIVLDRMGPGVVPNLISLFTDRSHDWYPRWGAIVALEMMGPDAKEAVQPLETVLKDSSEDVDVRVGAARALARINGTSVASYLQQIPNLQEQIVKVTRDKSTARRKQFAQSEAKRDDLRGEETTHGRWERTAQIVYRLVSNQELTAANVSLQEAASAGWNGSFMDVNFVRAFLLCHSKSQHFPGRITPETEAALKQYFFGRCDNQDQSFKQWKEQGHTVKDLTGRRAFSLSLHANKPMNFTSRDYLTLGVLKDDPEYKDKKFTAGDTVTERYNAWNAYFKEFLKDWALNGLWVELGSTSYEYHTYPSFINLADFAPDPEVRKRAQMYMDLVLVEAQQISIADLRAGSKSRAKKGGYGSNFNPYLHMIYGQRGRPLYHAPIVASTYQAPEAAILLAKLGSPVEAYEIVNRQAGEAQKAGGPHLERNLLIDSHLINYGYRTPEYIMGCSMYDPNRIYGHGCEGRWSGVVFRNRAFISIPAYSSEKWNVQSKDVMITQAREGAYYTGPVRIDLTSGFEKVEKDGWVFLDNGDSYGAIKVVMGGYKWNDPIKGSLGLIVNDSPIIIQTGRASDYKSFAGFQDAILKAPLKVEFDEGKKPTKVQYTGPNSSALVFTSNSKPFVLPTIDGKPIDLELEYNYRSPFIENRKGSDIVTVKYGDRQWVYDFAKNTVNGQ